MKTKEPLMPAELREDHLRAMMHQLAIIDHATRTRKRIKTMIKDCAKLRQIATGDAALCSKTLTAVIEQWDASLVLVEAEAKSACKRLGRMVKAKA